MEASTATQFVAHPLVMAVWRRGRPVIECLDDDLGRDNRVLVVDGFVERLKLGDKLEAIGGYKHVRNLGSRSLGLWRPGLPLNGVDRFRRLFDTCTVGFGVRFYAPGWRVTRDPKSAKDRLGAEA